MKRKNPQPDELEMFINFRAMRVAWIILQVLLIIWCIVSFIFFFRLALVPFLLLSISNTTFFLSKLVISAKLTCGAKKDEE